MLKQVRRGPYSGGKPLVLWPRRAIPLLLCGALSLSFCGALPLVLLETLLLFFFGALLLVLGALPFCRALLLLFELCGVLPLPLRGSLLVSFCCVLPLLLGGAFLLLPRACLFCGTLSLTPGGALPPGGMPISLGGLVPLQRVFRLYGAVQRHAAWLRGAVQLRAGVVEIRARDGPRGGQPRQRRRVVVRV
jgi:hypothetical protein